MTTASTPHILTRLDEPIRAAASWLSSHEADIAFALGAGLCVYGLLRLVRHGARRIDRRAGDTPTIASVMARTFARTTHIFMILCAARLVLGFANPPDVVRESVRFLFTIAAVVQGALWLRELVLGLITLKSGGEGGNDSLTSAMGIIRLLVSVAVFAVAVIVVLDNLGVNVTGLVAGLGIGGIAIGLAAQGIFSDLFAALSIIFDKPFRVGDTIAYDQTLATVEHIGLKSTRLRSLTGETRIISNTQLLQKEISNFQAVAHRRVSFPIGIVYHTDAALAENVPALVREVISAQGAIPVRAGFTGFGASSLDFECIFDVREQEMEAFSRVRHAVGMAILRRLRAEGVEFAYPTQTTYTAAPDGTLLWPYARPGA